MEFASKFKNLKRFRILSLLAVSAIVLTGCSSMGSAGPSAGAVKRAGREGSVGENPITIINLDDKTVLRFAAAAQAAGFADVIGDGSPFGSLISSGDTLDISIWEAPPAMLFGGAVSDSRMETNGLSTRSSSLPEQMVDTTGRISVPFAGQVPVAGKSPKQVEREISARLNGIAHQPQVVVRIARNATANVTVVGEVAKNGVLPLSPKGERLLDVIAASGGVKPPIGKTSIQLTRGSQTATMALDAVIKSPRNNVRLQSGDVIAAVFQPNSFTALGAIGNNAEIPFEETGLTLSQALGRIGGLKDDRAEVRGVFVFRMEDPTLVEPAVAASAKTTPSGKIPVIYNVDMSNPASFFLAQNFPIKDHDVIYVSNAKLVELQKFINMISSTAFSLVGISNSVK